MAIQSFLFESIPPNIHEVLGAVWVGTQGGLFCFIHLMESNAHNFIPFDPAFESSILSHPINPKQLRVSTILMIFSKLKNWFNGNGNECFDIPNIWNKVHTFIKPKLYFFIQTYSNLPVIWHTVSHILHRHKHQYKLSVDNGEWLSMPESYIFQLAQT